MDPQLDRIKTEVLAGKAPGFLINKDRMLRFQNRVCIHAIEEIRRKILHVGNNTPHSVRPGVNNLYKDLKRTFWLINMKQEVTDYVVKCLTCQRVKVEHQRHVGLLQPLEIPEWKWDLVSIDFVVGLPPTQRKNNMIWVIVDQLTKTAHFIAMKNTWTLDQLIRVYLEEIVRLHRVPSSIVSYWDTKFQSGILAKAARGVRDTVTLQYDLSPSHGWTYWENYSNPGGYVVSMCFGFQASLGWTVSIDRVFLQ